MFLRWVPEAWDLQALKATSCVIERGSPSFVVALFPVSRSVVLRAVDILNKHVAILPLESCPADVRTLTLTRRISFVAVMERGNLTGIIPAAKIRACTVPTSILDLLAQQETMRIVAATPLRLASRMLADRKLESAAVVDDSGAYLGVITRAEIDHRLREFETLDGQVQIVTGSRGAHGPNFGFVGRFAPDGVLLEVNNAIPETAGISTDDLIGLPFWDAPWCSTAVAKNALRAALRRAAGGEVAQCDVPVDLDDGGVSSVQFTFRPLRDRNGKVNEIAGFGVELPRSPRFQDNRAAENAEQIKQSQLHAIFEHFPECITLVDEDGLVVDINPAGLKLFNHDSIDLVLGRRVVDVIGPIEREQFLADVARIFADGGPVVRVYQTKNLRGAPRWIEQQAVGLRSPEDPTRVIQRLTVTRDITERKQFQDQLIRSERDYRGLFEQAHDAIVVFRADDEVVLDVNEHACEMYGFTRDEFIGMSLEKISVDVSRGKNHIADILQRSSHVHFESVQYRKDGTIMPLEISAAVVEYHGEQAILSINRDITRQKEAEARLVKAARREALATLAGGIAHEFNSLLLAAATYLHGLPELPAENAVTVAKTSSLIQQAQSLSASLLELFSGPEQTEPPVLAVGQWLPECIRNLADTLRTGFRVTLAPIAGALNARIDPLALEQVLRILITNAADALGRSGDISVSARFIDFDDVVEIRVTDNGPGVPLEDQDRIFEPFFTTRKRARRSGLGLAIASRLVDQSGGTLTYEPNQPQGSSFVMRLRAELKGKA